MGCHQIYENEYVGPDTVLTKPKCSDPLRRNNAVAFRMTTAKLIHCTNTSRAKWNADSFRALVNIFNGIFWESKNEKMMKEERKCYFKLVDKRESKVAYPFFY